MSQIDAMSCNVTAAFLGSGRVLANAANAAAVIAGVGCVMVGPVYSRLALAASILLWFIECYYAARVAIDRSLFRVLATDPEDTARAIDKFLKRSGERALEDRTRGALALWRSQIAVVTVQLTALLAGIILRIENF